MEVTHITEQSRQDATLAMRVSLDMGGCMDNLATPTTSKPVVPIITPLTPHIFLTNPAAGASFKGGSQPDTITVSGTVFLTCDDPGGECGFGRISGVTVKIGSAAAKPAFFKPDQNPAPGTVQSGSWQVTGTPAPTDANATVIIATLSMLEQSGRVATASTSVTVQIKNGSVVPPVSCQELNAELSNAQRFLNMSSDPETIQLWRGRITRINAALRENHCLPALSTLTGKAMLETDNDRAKGPFVKNDVSLTLEFSGTQVSVAPFDITLPGWDVSSGGGSGSFDPSVGSMTIPITVTFKGQVTLTLNLRMTAESGEAHGPFNPHGVRLGPDGSLTLAGAAHDKVLGVVDVNAQLTIAGTLSPLP